MTDKTRQEQAKEYFEKTCNTEDDGQDYPGITVTYKLFVHNIKAAFLAGHASRDEEVKELVDIIQKFVQQQEDMIQLARMMDDEYIPLDYYPAAKQLLSKYSTLNTIGETEEEPTELNP